MGEMEGRQDEIYMRSYIVSITHYPEHIRAHGDETSILMVAIKTAETSYSFPSLALCQS